MELWIMDWEFKVQGVIDVYESLIWTERFNTPGDFELTLELTTTNFSLLEIDKIIFIKESEYLMIIEDREIITDVEMGRQLIISGRTLDSVLDRRIVWWETVISGGVQDALKDILNTAMFESGDSSRKLSQFTFRKSTEEAITEPTTGIVLWGENVLDVVTDYCYVYDFGYKVTREGNKFIFELYVGKDRSYAQTENPYVVFSPDFDNFIQGSLYQTDRGYATTAVIIGEGQGSDRKLAAVGTDEETNPLRRREIFVQGGDLSQTIDGEVVSEQEYLDILGQRGYDTLQSSLPTNELDGSAETERMYKYGEDFFMGDILQFKTDYGFESSVRVTEFIRSQSTLGYSEYPTFTNI